MGIVSDALAFDPQERFCQSGRLFAVKVLDAAERYRSGGGASGREGYRGGGGVGAEAGFL